MFGFGLHRRFKNSEFYQKHQYRLERANDLLSFFSAICLILFLVGDQSYMALKRHALTNEMRITAVVTGIYSGVFGIDKKVIKAMARVPRHRYVGPHYGNYAYFNVALPVEGEEYMIPEPFITAIMVHLMDVKKTDNVLEVGFGYGYEAAVLSQLAGTVHSVKHAVPMSSKSTLIKTGKIDNVITHTSRGILGLPEEGPYDAILIRQSMTEPPISLLKQLKPRGRLVIPIGMPNDIQRLTVYTRGPGGITERSTLHVKISPLFHGNEI